MQVFLFDNSEEENTPQVPSPAEPLPPPVTSPQGKRVFVVDAYGLIYQVFHALSTLKGKSGESINAIFGFTRDIFLILEKLQPDLLFCAFDLHTPTFRKERFPEYKAQREKMPDELIEQIPQIKALLEQMRIPILAVEGFEADDLLATVAEQTEQQGGNCFLITSDKDCRQLISDVVQIYSLRRGQYLDRAFLQNDWGITPEQVVDYQAMVGDSSDNVPGIALIGPKMAAQLLQKFGSLDAILKPENLEAFFGAKPSKKKENLLHGYELAMLCRDLVRLERHVPLEIDWSAGDVTRFDYLAAIPTFKRFAFRSMIPKAEALATRIWGTNEEKTEEKSVEILPPHSAQTTVISVPRERAPIASFAGRFVPTDVPPLFLPPALFSEPEREKEALLARRTALEDEAVPKVGYNLKQVRKACWRLGISMAGPQFDLLLATYVLRAGENCCLENLPNFFPQAEPDDVDVAALQDAYLQAEQQRQQRLEEKRASEQMMLFEQDAPDTVPAPKKRAKKIKLPDKTGFLEYQNAFFARLYPLLQTQLAEWGVDGVCYDLEFPLIEVLAEMEFHGIAVDKDALFTLQKRFQGEIDTLRTELNSLAGEEPDSKLNLNSPVQLQKILFERLGLNSVSKTKTGLSTDASVLETLAEQHPFPKKLLEYRQLVKLQSTYVEALPRLIDPNTGRIHTTFHQAVTATGRLSSSEPNLQNIPVRTEIGRQIRQAFLARPEGWHFVSADYSQIELRVLAHYCGDENLCQAFFDNEDIHARVAGEVFGVELEDVTKPMRNIAKTVNFGIIYGQSAFGLAQQLGIPQDEAKQFIQKYFERFPAISTFLERTLDETRQRGFASTLLGRRRRLEGIRAEQRGSLNTAERMAVNTVIQGTAADLIKLAMLQVHARLHRENRQARLLLQIHDELIIEAPTVEIEAVQQILQEEMTNVWKLRVPLRVDVEVETHWG